MDSWQPELLAYFDTGGVSNGPTEAINPLIKKIKRVGHGFRNFDNYRLRLLLHCGVDWDTTAPPRSEAGYHAWLRRATNPNATAPYCYRPRRPMGGRSTCLATRRGQWRSTTSWRPATCSSRST